MAGAPSLDAIAKADVRDISIRTIVYGLSCAPWNSCRLPPAGSRVGHGDTPRADGSSPGRPALWTFRQTNCAEIPKNGDALNVKTRHAGAYY
jgi:hypothetical protein